nr:putative ribonuclease H-like domain-containing protein [Tanacetum cinerariifolium]
MFDCDNYFSLESDCKSWPPSSLYDMFQPSGGYHVVPPLYTGTFMPPKPNLVFNTAPTAIETDHLAFNPVETSIPTATPMPTSPKSDSSGKRRNRKACFVCKSVDHLTKDCDYHAKKIDQPTSMNYTHRGNHKQNASFTHTNPQKHMVLPTVFTQTKPISFTAVSPVSVVVPKINVTRPKYVHLVVTKSKPPIRRHITRNPSPKTSNLPPRVTAAKASVVSAAQGNPQHALKDKGVIDCGCSRHMTGNMSYLSDFEELNGGYVAFGGNPKGGRIFGKGKIKTINTVCYVQNRVLVTKPHNKTPYELLHGQTPSIGFMRPFGCLVTIHNTLDSLEKFNEKVDEGFLVRYSNNDGDVAFDGKEHDFDAKKPESKVNVSPSSSAQTRKQDDKTKKEAKGKSLVESLTRYRDLNAEAAGPSNVAASLTYGKSSFIDASQLPDDPDMLELEDIIYSDDDDDVGAEADFNNLETSIIVSPIPIIRVHKDHHVSQIIGDLSSTTQTRRGTQEEYKDERGIVIRNKARLFVQGHTQEDEIDYEEVFPPVARIEAIGLFLAYASFMGFMVYQTDIKSAFLYGTIEKEVFVCQPQGHKDPEHPDKVYKVVKALYGLHQAPRAWYETLANYLLENGFQREKPLLKDLDGEDVDVHTYRSMIGSLMYLTSSRPDIIFSGRMIANMDKDDVAILMDEKEEEKKVEEAKIDESAQVQGRQAESQAEIYKIDMDHASKVLSIKEDELLGIKCSKAFPLLVMMILLLVHFATVSAKKVIEFGDSYKAPPEETGKGPVQRLLSKPLIDCRLLDDLDTMSLDDVYNNLKVYELEVQKKSESNSQNMAFISSSNTSSGKGEVPTTSVLTDSIKVSTTSTDVAATSLSHDIVCAYIASQSNGSQIKYEDITHIDEDDIEEIDIKYIMALLSMRADRAPRSQDRGKRESYKQGPNEEEPAPKVLMAINGIGWD